MSLVRLILLFVAAIPSLARADVAPATIRVPEKTVWTGQRLSFFVELRAHGSFDGAASFSLPQVSLSVIIPVGNPVVSSEEIDGDSWFVQTHEFALFSQKTGQWELPSFDVRFASREGFTGPAKEQTATVPATGIEIRRPPGSDQIGFLITTETFDVSESWDPQPGPAKVGAVFKRMISQHADDMTGMALAPPPASVPDGIRVYPADPVVTDNTERGALKGQRQDTLTYVMREAGTQTLPALTYMWWNPSTQQLMSKTLPAATFEVTAPPVPPAANTPPSPRFHWLLWIGVAGLTGASVWQRKRIAAACRRCWRTLHPPERVAARKLMHACRQSDATLASQAWLQWLSMQESDFVPADQLKVAAIDLERQLYGQAAGASWQGHEMKAAFSAQLKSLGRSPHRDASADLPPLNP